MNERIYELAFQAGCNRTKLYDPRPPVIDGWVITQDELDKFAELIIRECAGVVEKDMDYNANWCSDKILKHFGIEK